MLWLAVLEKAGYSQAGRGNRETLYNTVLLIEIIWHCLKSLHYFEDRQKTWEKCFYFFSALFLLFAFFVFFSSSGLCLWDISGIVFVIAIFVWIVVINLTLGKFLTHYGLQDWHKLFSFLLFYRVWTSSGLGHVAPDLSSLLVSIPLTSLQPDGRAASSWEGLNGSSPLQTHCRPLTKKTKEEETLRQSEKTHPNQQQHFSRWQPTGSTKCVTWPAFLVPCTRLPLTPCGATPPLTCWPVATFSAGLGQTFPKRWLHCVSNK